MFFLVLVYVFNLDLFEFSAAILKKDLLYATNSSMKVKSNMSETQIKPITKRARSKNRVQIIGTGESQTR